MVKSNYNPKNEYVVDINDPTTQNKIQTGRQTFKNFVSNHRDFDLRDSQSVGRIYGSAKKEGIFDQAADLRKTVFGNITTTYGVSYTSDGCKSECGYCPINKHAKDVDGKPIKRKTLSVAQHIADTQEIMKDGHTHICILTGDGPLTANYRGGNAGCEKFSPYLQATDELGIRELILNVTPQSDRGFKLIRDAIKDTSLQFRVFQETYNRETYAKMHGTNPLVPKANFDFRRNSQARAIEAGLNIPPLEGNSWEIRNLYQSVEGASKFVTSFMKVGANNMSCHLCLGGHIANTQLSLGRVFSENFGLSDANATDGAEIFFAENKRLADIAATGFVTQYKTVAPNIYEPDDPRIDLPVEFAVDITGEKRKTELHPVLMEVQHPLGIGSYGQILSANKDSRLPVLNENRTRFLRGPVVARTSASTRVS
jgi:hypothetical protein